MHRSLRRDGITIDHITYYNNALRPWIQTRDRPEPLLIRRDPRDLSRIFVLDPERRDYLEIPYRTLSRPSITLWEHRIARKRLRERRHAAVDEESLFTAIDEMRTIERQAAHLTRGARRNRARRQRGVEPAKTTEISISEKAPLSEKPYVDIGSVQPFDDIESW